ncbi:MAG: YtxH domain-containing protein, partial [Flavobacteriaceae bacterium]|nr:YtxH domain-containing protein [Flavobacteriaceae bacterium]
GLILGAAAGAVAGLMMAPASGKETREKIADKAGTLKADLENKFNEISEKISNLDSSTIDDFKSKFYDVKGTVKEKYAHVASKVKDLEKELEDKIEALKKEAKEMEAKAESI